MNKACPVVLRHNNNKLDLLAFRHPDGSNQLVKGNIKKGERLDNACVRELHEESGIDAEVVKQLGTWQPENKSQIWGFCLMHYEGVLPDTWKHHTKDDGGHIFELFWQPLDSPLDSDWKKASKDAFQFIKNAIAK
jgi:ADP-ribose pyrophosphatase YjhB (NUDIX family)